MESPPAKPPHYLAIYRDLFARYPIGFVLELGVHKGSSLRFWRELAPTARIVGVDSDLGMLEPLPNDIEVVQGDASDAGVLAPYSPDLVVDDASHIWENQQASFDVLWPRTRLLYVIEDLHVCYGSDNEVWAHGRNTMDWLHEMVDAVHLNSSPVAITFHPGFVVIEK